MKNILKLGLVAMALFITLPAFAGKCNTGSCGPKSCATSCQPCAPVCKLPQPECAEIEYTTTCQGKPEYHWECKKVYHPCNNRVSTSRAVVRERCVGVKVEGEEVPYGEKAYSPKKHEKKSKRASY